MKKLIINGIILLNVLSLGGMDNALSASPLSWNRILNDAVILGKPERLEQILRKGANPNISFLGSESLFDYAKWRLKNEKDNRLSSKKVINCQKIVDLLKEYGTLKCKKIGKLEEKEIITLLHEVDDPLRIVIENNMEFKWLEYVMKHKNEMSVHLNHSFSRAIVFYKSNALRAIEYLLSKGADPNQADSFGFTSLMQAVRKGDLSIVKLLLDNGANLAMKNKNGCTALQLSGKAIYKGIGETLSSEEAKKRCWIEINRLLMSNTRFKLRQPSSE